MTSVSRVVARLRGISPRERALLAIGAACVAAFALTKWVVFVQIDEYRRTRAAIAARQATLSRYMAASGGSEEVTEALSGAAEALIAWEEGLLPGDNPQAAAARLQGIIKPWVERPDSRLMSLRTLAPVAKGPYAEVAVQVDLQTTTEGLAEILARVPRHPLSLRVKKFSVTSSVYNAAVASSRREALMVTVVVSGMTYGSGDETAGGGDR